MMNFREQNGKDGSTNNNIMKNTNGINILKTFATLIIAILFNASYIQVANATFQFIKL